MDVSRNYTEYWHHQQQIREAVGAPPLTEPVWLQSVIALGVRAVPLALRNASAPERATIHVHVTGTAGGRWWLQHSDGAWHLSDAAPADLRPPVTSVEIEAEDAARVWFAGRARQPAAARARISGDAGLADAALSARALMV